MNHLQHDISAVLNKHSAENESNTPDYVLAQFLMYSLAAFHMATNLRALHGKPAAPVSPALPTVTTSMLPPNLAATWAAGKPVSIGDVIGSTEPAPDMRPKPAEAQAAPVETSAEQQPSDLSDESTSMIGMSAPSLPPEWVEIRYRELVPVAGLLGRVDTVDTWKPFRVVSAADWDHGILVVHDDAGQLTKIKLDANHRRADWLAASAIEKATFFNPKLGEPFPDMPTRVTPDVVNAAIVSSQFDKLPGTQIIVCTLTLRNGAKVIGQNYGAIDPKRQDDAMGQKAAFAMAVEKVWELEGYLLRQRLHEAKQGGAA